MDTAQIRRALFESGNELPGPTLERFTAHLFVLQDADPDAAPESLVDRALGATGIGAVDLVASEPDLRHLALEPPVLSTEEAAMSALALLARRLAASRS